MPTEIAVLQQSLEKHNEAFESLLKLIPAKYYLAQDDAEAQVRTLVYTLCEQTTYVAPVRVEIPKEQQEAEGSQASHKRGIEEGEEGQGTLCPY